MDTEAHRLVLRILRESREEVARADGKASMLLAAAGVVIGVVVGAMLTPRGWRPAGLMEPWRAVWWVGAALWGVAIGSLGFAVWPRIGHKVGGPAATYFNDIALIKDAEAVGRTLERVDSWERDLQQLIALSSIARRKYLSIRRALACLAVGTALLVIAALCGG